MKKWVVFLMIIFAIVICRTYLFMSFFKYEIIRESAAPVSVITNQKLLDDLKTSRSEDAIDNIIQDALRKTSSDLSFTFNKCYNEVNHLAESKNANCIGYAGFLSAIIQYKLNKSRHDKQWKVHHKVGKIYFLNENINKFFDSNFFKDHDFVTVENIETKEIIPIDGTVYDYFKINRVQLK
ncbi:hypothetical protein PFY12_11900 [Chryseobacterium camelliae]|uniref:Transglutaminase-like domain-containing protein n=1 Tax=Chryseobacterium camelliae TaxID=1265445 RepID=A0ABY7QJA3_9FLAO|nr:hypothetical protein [Chryseobacterium camelliae]WBV59760.1 hypothetical protein PFY12_11900 [Chryseobacterium camelliae]